VRDASGRKNHIADFFARKTAFRAFPGSGMLLIWLVILPQRWINLCPTE
jgi:hypothetical protein